ncbi:hypothetical protein CEXT_520501 [Caerostris extrusa]|uniref:Uncharacterized protein n=1 Tax=Caerostris extrusa TaxID=172846 RepID=A0AAV4XJS9_CAEEX|nr:hypothetical protein CEXT_520501 [Caerostris extrusa]
MRQMLLHTKHLQESLQNISCVVVVRVSNMTWMSFTKENFRFPKKPGNEEEDYTMCHDRLHIVLIKSSLNLKLEIRWESILFEQMNLSKISPLKELQKFVERFQSSDMRCFNTFKFFLL